MKKRFFRTLLTLFLLVWIADYVFATEQDSESFSSWWENSKQMMTNAWDKSTQAVENVIKPLTESSASDEEKEALFAQIWKKTTPMLEKVLILDEENETLPDSAWLSKDKADNNQEINTLLDEAVDILSVSNTTKTRKRIQTLEKQIRDLKQTISQYRQAQISAPIRSSWENTVADYDEKIKQSLEQIEKYRQDIHQLKAQFAQELSEQGLQVTPEQLDVLLSSVVGRNLIQSSTVYNNVKQISEQLMTLTINSNEDLDVSQRYYGMYMVLLKILLHMQQSFITQIDEKYLPKIEKIRTEVQNITATTQNLLRGETNDNRRRHLLANREAQNLTLQTATLYQQHLIQQRGKIIVARDKTATDLQIAQNTYKTVRVSGELINLLRTSQKSFDLLLNIQVPDRLDFKNIEMKQEFAILTRKLSE